MRLQKALGQIHRWAVITLGGEILLLPLLYLQLALGLEIVSFVFNSLLIIITVVGIFSLYPGMKTLATLRDRYKIGKRGAFIFALSLGLATFVAIFDIAIEISLILRNPERIYKLIDPNIHTIHSHGLYTTAKIFFSFIAGIGVLMVLIALYRFGKDYGINKLKLGVVLYIALKIVGYIVAALGLDIGDMTGLITLVVGTIIALPGFMVLINGIDRAIYMVQDKTR